MNDPRFTWEMRGPVPVTRDPRIRPIYPPRDLELAGINAARCAHEWAGPDPDGRTFWCQCCLAAGEVSPLRR